MLTTISPTGMTTVDRGGASPRDQPSPRSRRLRALVSAAGSGTAEGEGRAGSAWRWSRFSRRRLGRTSSGGVRIRWVESVAAEDGAFAHRGGLRRSRPWLQRREDPRPCGDRPGVLGAGRARLDRHPRGRGHLDGALDRASFGFVVGITPKPGEPGRRARRATAGGTGPPHPGEHRGRPRLSRSATTLIGAEDESAALRTSWTTSMPPCRSRPPVPTRPALHRWSRLPHLGERLRHAPGDPLAEGLHRQRHPLSPVPVPLTGLAGTAWPATRTPAPTSRHPSRHPATQRRSRSAASLTAPQHPRHGQGSVGAYRLVLTPD
jgi:hypothetical protein